MESIWALEVIDRSASEGPDMSPLRSGVNSLWWDLAPVRWMLSLWHICHLNPMSAAAGGLKPDCKALWWNASLWGCFHTWFHCLVQTWAQFHPCPSKPHFTMFYLGQCHFCIINIQNTIMSFAWKLHLKGLQQKLKCESSLKNMFAYVFSLYIYACM